MAADPLNPSRPAVKTAQGSCAPHLGAPAAHSARIDQIFREHNQSLLRFLSARLSSEHDAKEVAQEAYVRLLQLDNPAGVSFLKAFLFKTAANLAIDRVRRRRHSLEERGQHFFELELEPEASAESNTSAAQDAELVSTALAELPDVWRSAFLLSRLDGLSTEEIAARFGLTDRAIRKYLMRTLLHLRTRLQQAHQPGRAS